MIGITLTVFMTGVSLVLADKTRTDSTYSDEIVPKGHSVWGRGVLAFLNSLNPHSFPPDWSQERADDDDKNQDSLVQNTDNQNLFDGKTDVTNLDYPRPEPTANPEPSRLNLKQSLRLWDNVERIIRNLLLSAQRSQKLTLRDLSTHSAAVMSSILSLASKFMKTCSTLQYVKSYRETVSANLLETFATPAEITNKLLNFLRKVRNSISYARTLVLRNLLPCRPTEFSRCPSSQQLVREAKLIQALGSLARTALASRSLQRAVTNYDEVSFLLSGQRDTTLYVLSVKTARVLKLLSNKHTCDLPLASRLQGLANENSDEDSTASLNHVVTLKHRYKDLLALG